MHKFFIQFLIRKLLPYFLGEAFQLLFPNSKNDKINFEILKNLEKNIYGDFVLKMTIYKKYPKIPKIYNPLLEINKINNNKDNAQKVWKIFTNYYHKIENLMKNFRSKSETYILESRIHEFNYSHSRNKLLIIKQFVKLEKIESMQKFHNARKKIGMINSLKKNKAKKQSNNELIFENSQLNMIKSMQNFRKSKSEKNLKKNVYNHTKDFHSVINYPNLNVLPKENFWENLQINYQNKLFKQREIFKNISCNKLKISQRNLFISKKFKIPTKMDSIFLKTEKNLISETPLATLSKTIAFRESLETINSFNFNSEPREDTKKIMENSKIFKVNSENTSIFEKKRKKINFHNNENRNFCLLNDKNSNKIKKKMLKK